MKKNCAYCGNEFEAKRSSSLYCKPNHRVAAARKAGVDPKTGEVLTTTKPKIVNKIVKQKGKTLNKSKADVKVADSILSEEEPYDVEKNLKAFEKMGLQQVEWITTGIPEFDELTQIPRGRLTQIEGRYAVGKTTLCLNMIQGLKSKRVLYIDSESSLNPKLLVALKVKAANFTLYNESNYIEDIAEVIRDAIKSEKYELIILDSVAMTTTRTQAQDVTSSNIGKKAMIYNHMFELIMGDLRRTKTALVLINQTRDSIGGYVQTTYTPGGTGILYNASLMISLKTIKSWRFPEKPKDGMYLGHMVEATITKSKVNSPWRMKKFKLTYLEPQQASPMDLKDEF